MVETNLSVSNFTMPSVDVAKAGEEFPLEFQAGIDSSVMIDELEQEEENPFLALMMQMLSENKLQDEPETSTSIENTNAIDETVSKTVSENQLPVIDTKMSEIPVVEPEIQESQLEQNVALTWIQSTSYVPPKSASPEHLEFAGEGLITGTEQLIPEEWLKELEPAQTEQSTILEDNEVENAALEMKPIDNSLSTESQSASTTSALGNPVKNDAQTIEEALKSVTTNTALESTPVSNSQQPQAPMMSPAKPHENPAPVHTLSIPVEVSHPKWSEQFAEHIVWMGQNQEVKSARIKLHPEELGPIEISVKVLKDNASITIHSHSAMVRDLMDQALPRLRDMMGEQGINLSDVNISADSSSQQFSQNDSSNEHFGTMSGQDEELQLTTLKTPSPKGLIDYFA